ncbi:MAG: AAA family ATPase [Solirubrobacteraceae bacterium]|nr:AAA family ATPase [Solirubrobacteraceae bacterium]
MHVREITIKGFKSFPDRTRLEFGPGVSVIVGPNGSGKSNVTDAILWVLGEQSPAAIRGRSMQDVIFAGGHGVQARSSAEVELILDNSDGAVPVPFTEISVARKISRDGEGEYRLNGARCRLSDVLELLSDTGLGKEMHSVISQGRVEAIVTSKPRDRRLLLEEAAGLGKHRRRRRAAQRKLERTEQNLERVVDIEQQARKRLGPLRRQAEAAELRGRLDRQLSEARWELLGEEVRRRTAEEAEASEAVAALRAARTAIDEQLRELAIRRGAAEAELQQRTTRREALARRASQLRALAERQVERAERSSSIAQETADRLLGRERSLQVVHEEVAQDQGDLPGHQRIAAIELQLRELDERREEVLARELAALEATKIEAEAAEAAVKGRLADAQARQTEAEAAVDAARQALTAQQREVDAARREAARISSEVAEVNRFLRSRSGGAPGGARALADGLDVAPGLEGAVAAALGGNLRAGLAADVGEAHSLLGRAGRDGGRILLAGEAAEAAAQGGRYFSLGVRAAGGEEHPEHPPGYPEAKPLAPGVLGDTPEALLARRLLAGAYLVDAIDLDVPHGPWLLVAKDLTVFDGRSGLVRKSPGDADEQRVLAERNRREQLLVETETAVQAEHRARGAIAALEEAVTEAGRVRDAAVDVTREHDRARVGAEEEVRRAGWAIEERERMPESGEAAVLRAQLTGELEAEKRGLERAERERERRAERIALLEGKIAADRALVPRAERLTELLRRYAAAVRALAVAAEAELDADRRAGEGVAQVLRECSTQEATLNGELRRKGDELTGVEVRKERAKDQREEASRSLAIVAEELGLSPEAREEPLPDERREELARQAERVERRLQQLGPVNPLAEQEYEEARAEVEELETSRTDLETALRELGTLIKETDQQIRDTFEQTYNAAAANFEELAAQVFPGGSGRLRLVEEDEGKPAATAENGAEAPEGGADGDEPDPEGDGRSAADTAGVEIEITPGGKSMKSLSLLSGGEKSMTALAFMFSVFLASPCPFYVLDEVEAALDDLNIGRFLELLRAYRDRTQFIVVTHQKRTMEAADVLYGVSMAGNGVSKVISRRLSEVEPAMA